MSINFLKEKNVKMLWDVVSDEDIFRFLTPDNQIKIYKLFLNNIEGFSENEGTKTNSLVDLNKKYILLILNHIKKTYSPSKIKIHNEQQQQQPLKELITFEEIQNDRKSQFEQDFNRIQEEFEDSISIKPPPLPEFTDPKGKTDEPIKEMDKILKEMQSRRNYEVEQINRSYNTSNVDNWLKPQETSLKTEKYENMKQEVQTNNRFKYLNELDNNLTPKKNVTFNNNDQVNTFISELEEVQDDEEINLFSKFKKVNKKEDNITLSINEEEDRISKLERSVTNLNEMMNKIISLLGERN